MNVLKQTGVTRKIDELGRIVIPKEIRKNLGIRDGEVLEILVDQDMICLKKHYEIQKYEDFSKKLALLVSNIYNVEVIMTDREKVITSSLGQDFHNKLLNEKLLELLDNRESYISSAMDKLTFGALEVEGYFTCVPIIDDSSAIGLIILVANKLEDLVLLGKFMAKIIVDKLDIF